jgi:Transposase DDE domain group 1
LLQACSKNFLLLRRQQHAKSRLRWGSRLRICQKTGANLENSRYNKRGTCEQWIKEGKGAIRWTRLSCRSFAANGVRLQLHALAYNLGNFLRTLATPEPIKDWSLTSL